MFSILIIVLTIAIVNDRSALGVIIGVITAEQSLPAPIAFPEVYLFCYVTPPLAFLSRLSLPEQYEAGCRTTPRTSGARPPLTYIYL